MRSRSGGTYKPEALFYYTLCLDDSRDKMGVGHQYGNEVSGEI